MPAERVHVADVVLRGEAKIRTKLGARIGRVEQGLQRGARLAVVAVAEFANRRVDAIANSRIFEGVDGVGQFRIRGAFFANRVDVFRECRAKLRIEFERVRFLLRGLDGVRAEAEVVLAGEVGQRVDVGRALRGQRGQGLVDGLPVHLMGRPRFANADEEENGGNCDFVHDVGSRNCRLLPAKHAESADVTLNVLKVTDTCRGDTLTILVTKQFNTKLTQSHDIKI